MAFPVVGLFAINPVRHSGMRLLAQARNPYSRAWLWIPGSRFARPGMTTSLLPSNHLLRPRAEHVLPRLLVERLLDEFADRQPRLHLRPGAHHGVPALDVRVIVERKTLRLVGHGPGETGD